MILLDTHALLWWLKGAKQLSKRASSIIAKEQQSGNLVISAISVWEICLIVKAKRLILHVDINTWLSDLAAVPNLQIISIDTNIAKTSVFLPGWLHKDPADRIIVATALRLASPIITADAKIRAYTQIETIW